MFLLTTFILRRFSFRRLHTRLFTIIGKWAHRQRWLLTSCHWNEIRLGRALFQDLLTVGPVLPAALSLWWWCKLSQSVVVAEFGIWRVYAVEFLSRWWLLLMVFDWADSCIQLGDHVPQEIYLFNIGQLSLLEQDSIWFMRRLFHFVIHFLLLHFL